jgi:hypothetical protein
MASGRSTNEQTISHRWLAVLLLGAFVALQVRAMDYWGAAFGAVGLAYALIAPHPRQQAVRWRRYGVYLITWSFVALALMAILKTLR